MTRRAPGLFFCVAASIAIATMVFGSVAGCEGAVEPLASCTSDGECASARCVRGRCATVEPRLDGGEDRRDTGVARDSGSMTGDDASTPRDARPMPTMDSGPPAGCAGGPLDLPIPDCRPGPVPNTGDPYADCVARINQLRFECQCLPPLGRWTGGESCADMHAEYDSTRPAHSGFRDRICDNGGSAQNECPGWGSIEMTIDRCLQVMWDEGPGEPFSEHGHYLNMTNTRFSEVACGFFTTAGGQVWAIQNFR